MKGPDKLFVVSLLGLSSSEPLISMPSLSPLLILSVSFPCDDDYDNVYLIRLKRRVLQDLYSIRTRQKSQMKTIDFKHMTIRLKIQSND
jgi:hypothetical protein